MKSRNVVTCSGVKNFSFSAVSSPRTRTRSQGFRLITSQSTAVFRIEDRTFAVFAIVRLLYLILKIHSHSAPILKNSVVGMEISYALKLLPIFHVPDSWDGTSGSWQSHHNSRMALLKRKTSQGSPSSLWEGVSKYHYSIHISSRPVCQTGCKAT